MSNFFQPLRFVAILLLCLTISGCGKNTIPDNVIVNPVTSDPTHYPIPDQDTVDQINNQTTGAVGAIDPCIATPTAPGCPGYVDPCVPPVPGCPGYIDPCIANPTAPGCP